MAEQKKLRGPEAEEQRLAKRKAPPQVHLDLLVPRGDGDLLFGISLDVVEARLRHDETQNSLNSDAKNDIGHKGQSNDPYSTICRQFANKELQQAQPIHLQIRHAHE